MFRRDLFISGVSIIIFLSACAGIAWHFWFRGHDDFQCSSKIVAHRNNSSPPFFSGSIIVRFENNGQGFFRMEGETRTDNIRLPLHRYVFFSYTTEPAYSGAIYTLTHYRIVKSAADHAREEDFSLFLNMISQGPKKLAVRVRQLNGSSWLFTSPAAPLFVCTRNQS